MRAVMLMLSLSMLSGNLIDGAWLGGDDLLWFWARFGFEAALGLIGAVISIYAGQLRERRGAAGAAREAAYLIDQSHRRGATTD
jgi:hypothetical protein